MNEFRVLLVDDEEIALSGLEQGVHWEKLGVARVDKAQSMQSVQRIVAVNEPDLMISDIEMPGGSGLDLIRWMRENHPHTICIFYTCHADFSYCQEAIRLGAVDYVLKPVPYEELEEVIRRSLTKVSQGRQIRNLEEMWGELTETPGESSAVEQVRQYIAANFSREISREKLAQLVYMSPDYLTRIFKKETGMSLSEYIIQKRIQVAKQLLATTSLSNVEIAQRTGFSYSSYFVTVFRKKTGMTPSQYRDFSGK